MKNKKFQYVIYIRAPRINYAKCCLKSGFLLLEIMIALMAFAGLAILVARYHVASLGLNTEALNYMKAVDIACDVIEQDEDREKKCGQCKVERTMSTFIVPQQLKNSGLAIERLKNMKQVEVKTSWISPDGQCKSVYMRSIIAPAKESL